MDYYATEIFSIYELGIPVVSFACILFPLSRQTHRCFEKKSPYSKELMGLCPKPRKRALPPPPTGRPRGGSMSGNQGEKSLPEPFRGHFRFRSLIFPALLTLFRHFLTPLFEETPVSASDCWESIVYRS
jgi:hypothetical protein